MLNLSKVIEEGLKKKHARNGGGEKEAPKKKTTDKATNSSLKPESPPLPPTNLSSVTTDRPMEQFSQEEAAVSSSSKAEGTDKEKALVLLSKEIEALELVTDEEEKIYRIGNVATLKFKDLGGCNPVMAAAKVREVVKESLLGKYDVEPEKLEEKLEDFKKKFRVFGTHCYIHALKQKI